MDESFGGKGWVRCGEIAGMSLYQGMRKKKRRPNGREGWGKDLGED